MLNTIVDHGLPVPASEEEIASARCPAPSVQDIIGNDAKASPPVLAMEQPLYLGSADVGAERYYDQAIFDAEIEKVWKRCWQWVCREDHIPEPGDYYTYEVAHLSYIVVR